MIVCEKTNVYVGKKYIVRDISFSIDSGEIMCILGKNGSGKSTLLKGLLGLLPYKGEIKLNGVECKSLSNLQRAKIIAYVPQITATALPFSLLEVVVMGRFCISSAMNYAKHDMFKALEILESFNLAHLAYRDFNTLSGGQKQLGLIARALCQDSPILVLDEPVSALDISYSFRLLEICQGLQKTIILTSHHPEQCYIAHKILMIKDGRKYFYGTSDEALTQQHISGLYDIEVEQVDLPNNGRYFCQIKN